MVNVPPEVFKQGLLQVVLVLLSEDCLLKKLLQSDVWVIFLFLAVQSQLDSPLLFVLDDRPDDDVEETDQWKSRVSVCLFELSQQVIEDLFHVRLAYSAADSLAAIPL